MTGNQDPADPFGTIVSHEGAGQRRLGNYLLTQQIGVGGMGEVYLAHHHRFHSRRYAVKLIRAGMTSSDAMERFEREIETMDRLEHPHLVHALDAGQQDQQLYLVMEFVDGLDVQQVLAKHGPLPIEEACQIVRQAAIGIAHAHRLGVIHRDIKPSNLMIGRDGQVKVLDMGMASLERAADSQLTAAGSQLGTAAFMSPEQWRDSHTAAAASDIYALGCTLYSLLTGRPPFSFEAGGLPELMQRHLNETPLAVTARRPEVPAELSSLVAQTLCKDPAQRIASAAQLAAQLEPFCGQQQLVQTLRRVQDETPQWAPQPDATVVPDQNPYRPPAIAGAAELDAGDELRWSRNVEQPHASMRRIGLLTGGLVLIGLGSLLMAYFGPGTTEAWTQRFDRLEMRKVPAGTGFLIELTRISYFVIATVYLVGTRFTASIRKIFDIRIWSRQLLATRIVTLTLVGFFVNAETQRHLSLDRAPADMVRWATGHGLTTTAAAEAVPYAWYLPYSLVNYIVVLGGLFAFPFFRFWLSDFRYMLKQLERFKKTQLAAPSADAAVRNLHRFGIECRSLTVRYIDVLGVLCTGIQFEYWIGRLTLTEAGVQTVVMGWLVVAFAATFVLAISSVYGHGYSATGRQLAAHESLQQEAAMVQLNLAWFLKTTVLSQLGGILLLSLAIVGLHAATR